MRYRLRTLLIVLALGPILIWGCWLAYEAAMIELIRTLIGPSEPLPAGVVVSPESDVELKQLPAGEPHEDHPRPDDE
jgi:hypothetical protein